MVSIQPKQEKGLRDETKTPWMKVCLCFNPAEAREGFKRQELKLITVMQKSFNPAEAREGFKRQTYTLFPK